MALPAIGKTGGALAPGGRVDAAVKALGGPRTTVKAPARAPASKSTGRGKGAPRPPRGSVRPQSIPRGRQVPNYTEGALNERQIQNIAHREAQGTLNSELAPLKAQSREIGQNELGAAERYQGYAGTANSLLSSLGQQQEASAKTFENQAAENALQSAKNIETSGQQLGSQTAGFLSPELRAELQAEGQREVGAGAAGNTFAQNSAQASGNLMAGLRGAAALRSVEGQGKITGYFQKEAQRNQEAQQNATARLGGNEGKLINSIAAENEKAYATNSALGLKTQLAQNTIAGTRSKIQNEAAKTRLGEEKLGLERAKGQSDAEYKHADAQYKLLSAKDKASYDKAQAEYKHYQEQRGGKGPSVAEANKYASEVTRVQTEANVGKERTPKAYQEARKRLIAANPGISQETLQAGLNLAFYGHLVGNDIQNAYAHGVSPSLKPTWFRKGK